MDHLFSYIVLAGLAIVGIGMLALLVMAFRQRVWWGLAVLVFPPLALAFAWKYGRKGVIPLCVVAFGGVVAATPSVYTRFAPVDLGPRERVVDGEIHVTLTGWDRKDYSFLQSKPDVVVLQMANPDVTDATLVYLRPMEKLRELDLNDTKVSDRGLTELRGHARLETLRLRNTAVTDLGFEGALSAMEALRQLDLRGTKVSRSVLDAWKSAKSGRRALQ